MSPEIIRSWKPKYYVQTANTSKLLTKESTEANIS
jgi:hypothetical protein